MIRIGALGLLLLAAVGCKSPIVGAECKPGFTLCGKACVDLRGDYRNCGSCGNDCGRFICERGTCSTEQLRDGGVADGGKDGGQSFDAALDAALDASDADGGGDFDPDAGLPGCGLGEQACAGTCSNPVIDPAHCGSCDISCGADQVCSMGQCKDACEAPTMFCSGQCFDLTTDPEHCGSCGKRCTSGICELGVCGGSIAGQAVVIGHDFVSANTAMQRLVGNAVFLASGAPVRVLVYRGEADPASVAGVEQAIDSAKQLIGRDWQSIDAIETLVPLQLTGADVLLIHAQAGATRSTLDKLGQQWGNAIAQFLALGGVIVVLDAPSSLNDGTFHLLEPAHIFSADSRETVTAQQLTVKTPGLGVAVRVPDRYMSADHTVHFRAVSTRGSIVVVDKDQLPVVVQRVIVTR